MFKKLLVTLASGLILTGTASACQLGQPQSVIHKCFATNCSLLNTSDGYLYPYTEAWQDDKGIVTTMFIYDINRIAVLATVMIKAPIPYKDIIKYANFLVYDAIPESAMLEEKSVIAITQYGIVVTKNADGKVSTFTIMHNKYFKADLDYLSKTGLFLEKID